MAKTKILNLFHHVVIAGKLVTHKKNIFLKNILGHEKKMQVSPTQEKVVF
jgi:hypothetical protein